LGELVIKGTRYAAFLVLPIVVAFMVFGKVLLQLWMGPHYSDGPLMIALAAGTALMIVPVPMNHVLMAMNLHGKPAGAKLIASAISVLFVMFVVKKGGLTAVALAATIPLGLINSVYLPYLLWKNLRFSLADFVRRAVVEPLLITGPFAALLTLVQMLLSEHPVVALIFSACVGGGILAITYWRSVLPGSLKTAIVSKLAKLIYRRCPSPEGIV
jgi:O-antigen/teichoic acid export membrane protein